MNITYNVYPLNLEKYIPLNIYNPKPTVSLYLVNKIQLSPEGEVKSGNYYRDAQRRGIYLAP